MKDSALWNLWGNCGDSKFKSWYSDQVRLGGISFLNEIIVQRLVSHIV